MEGSSLMVVCHMKKLETRMKFKPFSEGMHFIVHIPAENLFYYLLSFTPALLSHNLVFKYLLWPWVFQGFPGSNDNLFNLFQDPKYCKFLNKFTCLSLLVRDKAPILWISNHFQTFKTPSIVFFYKGRYVPVLTLYYCTFPSTYCSLKTGQILTLPLSLQH